MHAGGNDHQLPCGAFWLISFHNAVDLFISINYYRNLSSCLHSHTLSLVILFKVSEVIY